MSRRRRPVPWRSSPPSRAAGDGSWTATPETGRRRRDPRACGPSSGIPPAARPGGLRGGRRRGLPERRHRRLRGGHRHGQEPRLSVAGGVRRRRRRPPRRREHQDQGAAAPAGEDRAPARRRRAASGLAVGAAHGARELPVPQAHRRGGGRRIGDAPRPRPHAGAGLSRGASAARGCRPLRPALPGDAGAAGARRPGARVALVPGDVPRALLPRTQGLPLAAGAQPGRGRPPGLRQPRPAAHRTRDAPRLRGRRDRRGAPPVPRGHGGLQRPRGRAHARPAARRSQRQAPAAASRPASPRRGAAAGSRRGARGGGRRGRLRRRGGGGAGA